MNKHLTKREFQNFQIFHIREVKHDVYGKRQTAKIELLVSDFSRLYNLGKLFAFTVIKGFFSYFSTGFMSVLKKK